MHRDPDTMLLPPDAAMPNSRLPVLIYRGVLAPDAAGGTAFDTLFARHGWGGVWHNGIYDFDHYHSNAHEVLGIAAGTATVQLGGGSGQALEVIAGDVLVLPAGTGHRRVAASADLDVVGAYPPGQEHYDIWRGHNPDAELRIARVKLPETDPVGGALARIWG